MKSIANQYRDLQEGRMSQFNFMRNLRMSMPQVTNTTSFGDAVKILKNKGIITEAMTEEEEVFSQGAQDENYDYNRVGTDGYDGVSEEEDKESNEDAEFDALLKKIEDEMAGEEAVKAQYDIAEEETLKEAKGYNEVHDHIYQEVIMGIQFEHENYPEKTYEEIVKIVLKNLKKSPQFYTNFKLTGVEGQEPTIMGNINPADRYMKDFKDGNLVDKAMGMKKAPVQKKKLKEAIDDEEQPQKMRFRNLPADPEKYKIVRDSKGYIIKATNSDGVEFQKGDVVKTYDGDEIKIAKFEESQGVVKAIYSTGMFFRAIDIDGLEAPKDNGFRPGVNIGGSFEKFKSKLAEMVREAIAEMYDGRDNIDAEIED